MKEKNLKNETTDKYEKKLSLLWGAVLFLVLLVIDQITKVVADVYFNMEGTPSYITLLPSGILGLCISYNPGIAFGSLGNAQPIVKIGIIVGTAAMMIVLAVLWWKLDHRRTVLRVALVLIIAGGVGNLIDRVYYRIWDSASMLGVRDMVQVDIGAFFREILHWNVSESFLNFGICNFADFFIVGGAVVLVLALFFFDREAIFPVGKKYKALAKEAEEKKAEKQAKNG